MWGFSPLLGGGATLLSSPPPAALDPPTIRESIAPTSGLSASTTSAAAVGDLVIAVTLTYHSSAITHTTQGGWTELDTDTFDITFGDDVRMSVAAQVAASGGVQSYTPFSASAGTSYTALLVLQVGTYDATWASTFVAASATSATDTAANPPSVTATDGALVIAFAGWRWATSVTATITPPSGYTEAVELSGGAVVDLSIATKEVAAGAEDPGTFTDDQTASGWIAITVAMLGTAPPIAGEASITLGAATSSAAGELAIAGAAAVTAGAATATATGALAIKGAASVTTGAATATAAGTLPITGAASPTTGAATSSATGTLPIVGAAAVTTGAATSTATGALPIVGAAAATTGAATASVTGALPIVGALSATLGAATLSATGELVAASGTGDLNVTLGAATATAAGKLAIAGASAGTTGAATSAATGRLAIAGVGAATTGAATSTAAGSLSIAGSAAVTTGAATSTAAGALAVTGQAAVTLDAATSAATGALAIAGSLSKTLGAATATSVGDLATPITPTAASLRAFVAEAIADLTPRIHAQQRFVAYRGEGDGVFTTWAQSVPAAALRRYQVRSSVLGGQDLALTDFEGRAIDLEILIAYPQTSRLGSGASLDRDAAIRNDQRLIERAVGLQGFAAFSGGGAGPRATWVGGSVSRVPGAGVDFLVIRQTMRFDRAPRSAA